MKKYIYTAEEKKNGGKGKNYGKNERRDEMCIKKVGGEGRKYIQ